MTKVRLIPLRGALSGSAEIRSGASTQICIKLRSRATGMHYFAVTAEGGVVRLRQVRQSCFECAENVYGIIGISDGKTACEGYVELNNAARERARCEALAYAQQDARKRPVSAVEVKPASAAYTPAQVQNTGSAATRPTGTAEKKPTGSAATQPTGTAEKKPTGTAAAKSMSTAEKKPTGSAATQPTGTAEKKPTGSAATQPTGTTEKKPTGSAATQPTGTTEKKPTGTAARRPESAVAEDILSRAHRLFSVPAAEEDTPRIEKPFNPFPKLFPNSRWHNEGGTLYGEITNGRQRFEAVAVEGKWSPRPPRHLRGFNRYITASNGVGYWVRIAPQK